MFSKRHYEWLAAFYRQHYPAPTDSQQTLWLHLAMALEAHNPRFNRDRFLAACIQEEHEAVATVGNSEDTGGPHQQEGFQLGHREGLRSCWSASWSAARGGVKR